MTPFEKNVKYLDKLRDVTLWHVFWRDRKYMKHNILWSEKCVQMLAYLINVLSIVPQWNNSRLSFFDSIGNRISD